MCIGSVDLSLSVTQDKRVVNNKMWKIALNCIGISNLCFYVSCHTEVRLKKKKKINHWYIVKHFLKNTWKKCSIKLESCSSNYIIELKKWSAKRKKELDTHAELIAWRHVWKQFDPQNCQQINFGIFAVIILLVSCRSALRVCDINQSVLTCLQTWGRHHQCLTG